ncbi:MAG: hypothetical protein ACREBJ_10485, partial [Nitrosotalea sp.]
GFYMDEDEWRIKQQDINIDSANNLGRFESKVDLHIQEDRLAFQDVKKYIDVNTNGIKEVDKKMDTFTKYHYMTFGLVALGIATNPTAFYAYSLLYKFLLTIM